MEAFMLALRRGVARFVAALVPYLRQALRIAALPYCFFFQVDWTACTRPRLVAAFDLVYIFAKFGYYPDNYGLCRLYDYPRSQWKYYFGSGYNPFQRYLLGRKLQPERFHILFEDKEVCQQLCQGAGLPTPKLVGVLPPEADLERFLVAAGPRIATDRVILKPVSGLGGAGVFVAERDHEGWHLLDRKGHVSRGPGPVRLERYVVQEFVRQHPDLSAVYPNAVNSFRAVTLMKEDGGVLVLGTIMRFGRNGNVIDNISAGGIAVAVDPRTGRACGRPLDKTGRIVEIHPDTGFDLRELVVPLMPEAWAMCAQVQRAFPYYRMLGLDVAIGETGPILLEINAYPDLAGFESHAGPFLADPEVLFEFDRAGALTSSMRRVLRDDLREAKRRAAGSETR